jgi:hypothetical protein
VIEFTMAELLAALHTFVQEARRGCELSNKL